MNIQERILDFVYGYPGNITDISTISRWTGLSSKTTYKALEHLKNRGAIQKEKEIILEKGNLPIIKLKILITPKTMNKARWILNKMDYKN